MVKNPWVNFIEKQKYLESLGIKVLRFNSLDIVENLEGIFFNLLNYFEGLLKTDLLHPNPPLEEEEGNRKSPFLSQGRD